MHIIFQRSNYCLLFFFISEMIQKIAFFPRFCYYIFKFKISELLYHVADIKIKLKAK